MIREKNIFINLQMLGILYCEKSNEVYVGQKSKSAGARNRPLLLLLFSQSKRGPQESKTKENGGNDRMVCMYCSSTSIDGGGYDGCN